MQIQDTQTTRTGSRLPIDRGLLLLVGGALLLILLGLIAIPLSAWREPTLAAANTPEGVVQRFYQAVYRDDYATAYSYVSADARQRMTLEEFQQQTGLRQDNSRIQLSKTTISGESATVTVTESHFYPGGPFDSGEWSSDSKVLLRREGQDWKITSGPFYVPDALR